MCFGPNHEFSATFSSFFMELLRYEGQEVVEVKEFQVGPMAPARLSWIRFGRCSSMVSI